MPVLEIREVGHVREVKKNIAKISGFLRYMNGQIVRFAGGVRGMVVGFDQDEVLVLLFGDEAQIRVGQEVYSLQEEMKVPVGEDLLGRVFNPLGDPLDGKDKLTEDAGRVYQPIFSNGADLVERTGVAKQFWTGTKMVDALIPIACGQRQLVIGDPMTGKTTIAVDAILNQKGRGVVCIYCSIGKSHSSLIRAAQIFKMRGAMNYTIIIAATASSVAGEQYVAPYTACAFGEYFMRRGKDVFVVIDDLTKHAWAYRQISLLLERPPGREAYPGDIYYMHSQLIERAGKLRDDLGGGSLSLFPIVETLQGDTTGYISSNLVSMTDGQIYLSSALFNAGFKPAIDLHLSVSILGGRAQSNFVKGLSGLLRLEYAEYKEILRLTKLKSDVSAQTKRKIRRGEAIETIFAQNKNEPATRGEQTTLLYALSRRILDELDRATLTYFKNEIWDTLCRKYAACAEYLETEKDLSEEIMKRLDAIFEEFLKKDQKD